MESLEQNPPPIGGSMFSVPSRITAGERTRRSYEEYGVREIASLIDEDPVPVDAKSDHAGTMEKLDRKLKAAVLALMVCPPASIPFQELSRSNGVGLYGASRHKARIYVARTSAPNSLISSGEVFSTLVDNMPIHRSLYGALFNKCAIEEKVIADYGSNKRIVRVVCNLPSTGLSARSIEFVLLYARSTHETTQGVIELTVATSVHVSTVPVLKDCHRGHIAFCGFAVCRQPSTENKNSEISYVFSARPFPREMYVLYASLEDGVMTTMVNLRKLYTAVLDKFIIAKERSYGKKKCDDASQEAKFEEGYHDIIEEEEFAEASHSVIGSTDSMQTSSESKPAQLRRIGKTGESSLSERLQNFVTTVLRREMPEEVVTIARPPPPPAFHALRSNSLSRFLSPMDPSPWGPSTESARKYSVEMEGPDSLGRLPSVSPARRVLDRGSPKCISHHQDCYWAPHGEIDPPPNRVHVQEILDRLVNAKSEFFGAAVDKKMDALKSMRAVYIALATHIAYNDDLLFDDENPVHLTLADDYYGKNGSAMSYLKIHEASYFREAAESSTLSEFVASHKRISQLLYRYGALPVGMARVLTYKHNNQRRKRIGGELFLRVMENGELSWLSVKEGDEYLESKVLGDILGKVTRKRPVHMTPMALFCEQTNNLLSELWGHYDSVLLIVHALFAIESHWTVDFNDAGGTLSWKSLTFDIPVELAQMLNTLKASVAVSPMKGGLHLHKKNNGLWKVFSNQLACAARVLSEVKRSNDPSNSAIHSLGLAPMMKSMPDWLYAATGVNPPSPANTSRSTRDTHSNEQPNYFHNVQKTLDQGDMPLKPKLTNRTISLPEDFLSRPRSPNSIRPMSQKHLLKPPSPAMTTSDDADECRPESYCKDCPDAKHCTMSMARSWRDIEELAMVGKAKDLLSLSW